MNTMRRVLLPLLSSFAVTASAAPETLWSLGRPDRSGKEFAFAGRYEQFPAHSGAPLYADATSVAANQWPYIHPGPEDRWAGSTTHPLTIGFHLEEIPRGECALVLDLVGSHALPLELESKLNGTAARLKISNGGGDAALADENAGKPSTHRMAFHPTLLRKGRNEVTLAVVSGSWLLYDALRMEHSPEKSPRLLSIGEVDQTPFFSRGAEGMRQNLRVTAMNAGADREVLATARCGDAVVTSTLTLPHGESRLDVATPVVDEPASVSVTLFSDDEEAITELTLLPQRRWKLYIAPSIHTDIGYTDTQEAVFKRHNTNLDAVIELCRQDPLFKWNIEVAWEMQNYMADRPATATQALLKLIEEERVGLHAGYLNELTALLSDEAMNRYIYYATDLRRRYGMDTASAILTDVPSATWSLPSMLAASGVRFFAQGSNQTRAPILRNSGIRDPFYWEGPDGARVLMWITESYAQSIWLARTEHLPDLQNHVANLLRPYGRDSYPYDAVYVYGAFFDNEPVDMRYGALLHDWNEKWVYPKLILSTSTEFADYMEANYRERIPVKRCDFGGYWEDGAGSTSHETTLHLNSQRRITAAETLWSLARLAGAPDRFPADSFRKAWEDILFYAEHTWGAAQSISDPDGEMTRSQWSGKAKYATHADRDTNRLLDEGLDAFVRTVPATAGEVVVVNSHSWDRSGLVAIPGETGGATKILDRDGQVVPSQNVDGRIVFHAADVPGFGSRVYQARPVAGMAAAQTVAGSNVLENAFYRVRLDETRGVASIVDIASGKELSNVSSPYAPGQVLYAAGGEDSTLIMDNSPKQPEIVLASAGESGDSGNGLVAPAGKLLLTPARVSRIEPGISGPIFSEAIISSSAPSLPDIRTHVRLYHLEKRIGFDVRMTSKTEIRGKEAVYVTFPFAAKQPQFRLGMTNAVSRPDTDFARGACHEWYCVQDFVSCRDGAAGADQPEVVWTALDAPLITLSQVNSGRWSPTPELTTGTLFSYAMNNYWFTNYKAGQGGDFRFRYELTSRGADGNGGELSNEECLRFSRNVSTPLLAALSPGVTWSDARDPRLRVAGLGVIATTLKPAENGRGVIVRLRNAAEQSTTATVHLEDDADRPMERLNLVEEEREFLHSPGGRAEIPLKPQQTATVRVSATRRD